ncbi:hypothetical protein LCGC14_1706930 [marine sediment metagenome]|uniref:Uncharacterized protein n=1 Tax=marine sediment metagenome TaxID=412755 RepID=A0A0F9KGD3_9ZZZZ
MSDEQCFFIELTGDELVTLILDTKQLFRLVDTLPDHISNVSDSIRTDKLKSIKHLHDLLDDAYDNQVTNSEPRP